mgnify:CR=1 FL=1
MIVGLEDKWDFFGLSTLDSLNDKDWFLTKYARKLDWEYISLHSRIFTVEDKQQLNNVISAYRSYISFKSLSERQDVDIIQIIKGFPEAQYDYNALIANGKWRVTQADINQGLSINGIGDCLVLQRYSSRRLSSWLDTQIRTGTGRHYRKETPPSCGLHLHCCC